MPRMSVSGFSGVSSLLTLTVIEALVSPAGMVSVQFETSASQSSGGLEGSAGFGYWKNQSFGALPKSAVPPVVKPIVISSGSPSSPPMRTSMVMGAPPSSGTVAEPS